MVKYINEAKLSTVGGKYREKDMNMPDAIKNILEYAIMAPSGDNCQPWLFSYSQDNLDIFNNPESDSSLYNWGQRASMVSHGALLQNIILASGSFGYNAKVQFFPDKNNENHVARIKFERISENKNKEILSAISNRVTNRKIYNQNKLSDSDQSGIVNQPQELLQSAQFVLVQDREKINNIANAVALNEKVLFENQKMHSFFYSHINWTSEENNLKKKGFDIKTLELPGPALIPFKLFSNWNILKFFNKLLKFSKILFKQNSTIYASASGMGLISISSEDPIDYVKAGMLFENIWIKATSLRLSFQPLTGVLFLNLRLKHEPEELSKEHQHLIKEGYETIKKNSGINGSENIVLCFRIGYANNPTAKAKRFSLDHFIIER